MRSSRLSPHPETIIPAALKIPDDADQLEVHRFAFRLVHGQSVAHAESVSLRTAKVLVKDLENGNPFVKKFWQSYSRPSLRSSQTAGVW
jgi:hypothetical protein